ncbi:MAG: hypothetical protein WBW71_02175 [Bacteroidota bacterium]
MKQYPSATFAILRFSIFTGVLFLSFFVPKKVCAQGVKFMRDISPAEGIVFPRENPYREEICLNGKWDFQPVSIPEDWTPNTGVAPLLSPPVKDWPAPSLCSKK